MRSSDLHNQIDTNINHIDTLLSALSTLSAFKSTIPCPDDTPLIWQHQPQLDYRFLPCPDKPIYIQQQSQLIGMQVQTRYNWISQYLDRQGVQVYGSMEGGRVRVLGEQGGTVRGDGGAEQGLGQFVGGNERVWVQFGGNRWKWETGNGLVRIRLGQQGNVVVRAVSREGPQSQSIRRVIVFRVDSPELSPGSEPGCPSLKTHSGFYQPQDFTQDLLLPAGTYILMPFSSTLLTLYTCQPHPLDMVPQQHRHQLQQLNLMLQGFHQCRPQRMCAEFIREADLNMGIVIEIYRNAYENEISFKDVVKKSEDKRLMFKSLYSKRYQSYRLRKGQVIVEFYELTAKPAVLYQPQKKVLVDKDQDHEARTIHAILK